MATDMLLRPGFQSARVLVRRSYATTGGVPRPLPPRQQPAVEALNATAKPRPYPTRPTRELPRPAASYINSKSLLRVLCRL